VQQWLRDRVDQSSTRGAVRPELFWAWHLLQESGGRCRVDDLARAVALSPRQLRSLMVAEIGVSPKQLAKAFRFDQVIARLTDGARSLADVAAATGYADQAHLTREFQQMAGCSPTQWLAEERRNIQDGGYQNRPESPA
jgi:transcriptional regulator GlxA family with amidase domain